MELNLHKAQRNRIDMRTVVFEWTLVFYNRERRHIPDQGILRMTLTSLTTLGCSALCDVTLSTE